MILGGLFLRPPFHHLVGKCLPRGDPMGTAGAYEVRSELGGEFYDGVKAVFLPDGHFSSPVKDLDWVEEWGQPSLGAWGGASLRKARIIDLVLSSYSPLP